MFHWCSIVCVDCNVCMFSLLGVSWFTDDVLSIWIVMIVLCLKLSFYVPMVMYFLSQLSCFPVYYASVILFCFSGLWLVCAVSSKCDYMLHYCFVYLDFDCFILFPIIDISCFTLVTILAIMLRAFTFLLSNTFKQYGFQIVWHWAYLMFAHSGVLHILCCVILSCFTSSCVSYVGSFSGLSIFDCPFCILWRLLIVIALCWSI